MAAVELIIKIFKTGGGNGIKTHSRNEHNINRTRQTSKF